MVVSVQIRSMDTLVLAQQSLQEPAAKHVRAFYIMWHQSRTSFIHVPPPKKKKRLIMSKILVKQCHYHVKVLRRGKSVACAI